MDDEVITQVVPAPQGSQVAYYDKTGKVSFKPCYFMALVESHKDSANRQLTPMVQLDPGQGFGLARDEGGYLSFVAPGSVSDFGDSDFQKRLTSMAQKLILVPKKVQQAEVANG